MRLIVSVVFAAILMLVGSCAGSKVVNTPFVGFWKFDNSRSEDSLAMCELRIDFSSTDSILKAQGNFGSFFVFDLNGGIGEFRTNDTIISHQNGMIPEEIAIEYIHQETGEIWSAKLVYHPETKDMTFINGKRIKKGPNTPKEGEAPIASDFEGVHWIEPDTVRLSFVSDDPHFSKEDTGNNAVDPEEIVEKDEDNAYSSSIQLEDRLIYEEIDNFGERQLRCRYNNSNEIVTIVDMEGESPLSVAAYIVKTWATSDNKGALLVVMEGGTELTTLSLLKVNADNRVEYLDSAFGLSANNQLVGSENISDDMLPSITKEKGRIKVYSPSDEEPTTRFIDL